MNDDEFLTYCYWHARTERHLFAWADVRRLLTLSCEYVLPVPRDLVYSNDFVGMDFEFVEKRVERAREWLEFRARNPRVREAVEGWCPVWHL